MSHDSFRLDHLILTVDDLDLATAHFRELGFTVYYGGTHAAGTTHNTLMNFADGSYLELMALTGEPPQNDALDFATLFVEEEGPIGYALLSSDLDADVASLRERGVSVSEVQNGSRARPDGELLRWKLAFVGENRLPILIQDETPRELRVPMTADKVTHPNGVTGIAEVLFLVDELHTGITRYQTLLNVEPQVDEEGTECFSLGETRVRIRVPMDAEMERHLHLRPNAPYEIILRTSDKSKVGLLDESRTHGLRIVLA